MTTRCLSPTVLALPVTLSADSPLPAVAVAQVEEVFWTLPGLLSVEIRYTGPLDAETVCGWGLLFNDSTNPQAVRRATHGLLEATPGLPAGTWAVGTPQRLAPDDWAEAWKRFWHITPITPTLVIRPSWEPYEAQPGETVMTLDPGCAFGTGAHETTRLMLCELEKLAGQRDFSAKRLLDVGCGSGILAIAAALWGAQDITAMDIDPEAVRATRENATLNGVGSAIHVTQAPLAELPDDAPFDVILANIQAPVILELLPAMHRRMAPGGVLLASGLIARSVDSVAQAMCACGLTAVTITQQGDWFALSGTHNA